MISNTDINLRLLWISDIHFKGGNFVENTLGLDEYLGTFVDKCAELERIAPFDYLLISGDIAYGGDVQEYQNFTKYILSRLQSKLSKHVKLLIIPGNHDVSRAHAQEMVNGFLNIRTARISLKEKMDRHKKYLNDNYQIFCDMFGAYTAHFKDNAAIPLGVHSSLGDNHFLFGHVVDLNKKAIFVLLNTAWYSLGPAFLDTYLSDEVFSHTAFSKEKQAEISKALRAIGDEYGNQITAVEIERLVDEITKMKEQLAKYPDYVIITVQHHPINWLGWSERIQLSESNFHQLRRETDLLLTGHEHVPHVHQAEYMHEMNLLHIPAGCLIGDTPADFSQNWFSTLDINVTKRNVRLTKYGYDDGTWQIRGAQPYASYQLNKKYNTNLTQSRKSDIIEMLQGKEQRKLFIESVYSLSLVEWAGEFQDREGNIYIYVDNLSYYSKNIETVKELLLSINSPVAVPLKVYFVHADLNFDLEGAYETVNNRMKILGRITDQVDFEFDRFRREIYSSLDSAEAGALSKVKMIATVCPYWYVESKLQQL
jgi:3',5'-cyclic AMP phosphodiesterase CpdA